MPVHLASRRRQVSDSVPIGESRFESVAQRVERARTFQLQRRTVAVRGNGTVEHGKRTVISTMRPEITGFDQQRAGLGIAPSEEESQQRSFVRAQLTIAFGHQDPHGQRASGLEARIGRDRLTEVPPRRLDMRLSRANPGREGHRRVLVAQPEKSLRDEIVGPRPVTMAGSNRVQPDQCEFGERTIAAQLGLAQLEQRETNIARRADRAVRQRVEAGDRCAGGARERICPSGQRGSIRRRLRCGCARSDDNRGGDNGERELPDRAPRVEDDSAYHNRIVARATPTAEPYCLRPPRV